MEKTTFQQPEIRDANDNIIQAGAYGKNTAFCNIQNTGILDYINNNLIALKKSIDNFADNVYDKTELDSKLDSKANANTVYTKVEVDTKIDTKAEAEDVYTKTETDVLLDTKADKTEVDELKNTTSEKVDKTTYDDEMAQKADKSEVELKANQVDLQALASTSEIVASGNDYIRWVNGLQICWGSLSSESGKISTANFPQAFIDMPIITLTSYNGGTSATTSDSRVATLRTGTNNTTVAWHVTSFTNNSSTSARYIAIGRWK